MAYPSGWMVGHRGLEVSHVTFISQLTEDHARLNFGRQVAGYQVLYWADTDERMRKWHDVLPGDFSGYLEVLEGEWGYDLSAGPEESRVLGAPAFWARGTFGLGLIADCLIGNPRGEWWFHLCIGAPSEEALDEFMPTWDLMLASIKPS